jgi:hypothetical protein
LLEADPPYHLQDAWIIGAIHESWGWVVRANPRVHARKARMICDVERLRAKLEVYPIGDRKRLVQCDVERYFFWSSNRTIRRVSKEAISRNRKRTGIEDLVSVTAEMQWPNLVWS